MSICMVTFKSLVKPCLYFFLLVDITSKPDMFVMTKMECELWMPSDKIGYDHTQSHDRSIFNGLL